MEPAANWEEQYRGDVGPKLVALVVAAQIAATRESDTYVAAVLNELALGPATVPGVLVPEGMAGWAGDGRQVGSLLEGAVVIAGRSYNAAVATPEAILSRQASLPAAEQALVAAERWIEMVAQTIISDAARAAESVAMVQREWVDGYVRMLNPPSCSRCAVLAGRFYRWDEGFERHPRCDCVHIPTSEAHSDDLRVNLDRYFESLSRAEQDKTFTIAGAEAIRDGADIGQVVNARRGMTTAQQIAKNHAHAEAWSQALASGATKSEARRIAQAAFRDTGSGRRKLIRNSAGLYVTDEGASMRGQFERSRRAGQSTTRLMPESIYELAAGNRAEAIRLLKLNGFIP